MINAECLVCLCGDCVCTIIMQISASLRQSLTKSYYSDSHSTSDTTETSDAPAPVRNPLQSPDQYVSQGSRLNVDPDLDADKVTESSSDTELPDDATSVDQDDGSEQSVERQEDIMGSSVDPPLDDQEVDGSDQEVDGNEQSVERQEDIMGSSVDPPLDDAVDELVEYAEFYQTDNAIHDVQDDPIKGSIGQEPVDNSTNLSADTPQDDPIEGTKDQETVDSSMHYTDSSADTLQEDTTKDEGPVDNLTQYTSSSANTPETA